MPVAAGACWLCGSVACLVESPELCRTLRKFRRRSQKQVPCPHCGSLTCAIAGGPVCIHTRMPRAVAPKTVIGLLPLVANPVIEEETDITDISSEEGVNE